VSSVLGCCAATHMTCGRISSAFSGERDSHVRAASREPHLKQQRPPSGEPPTRFSVARSDSHRYTVSRRTNWRVDRCARPPPRCALSSQCAKFDSKSTAFGAAPAGVSDPPEPIPTDSCENRDDSIAIANHIPKPAERRSIACHDRPGWSAGEAWSAASTRRSRPSDRRRERFADWPDGG
jgi:hypothetical protein